MAYLNKRQHHDVDSTNLVDDGSDAQVLLWDGD